MANYIDFSPEEEQALSLSQFLNQAKTKGKDPDTSFVDACTKLINDKKYVELWNKLLEGSSVLFVDTPEKEVEGFFAAVTSLLRRLGIDAVHQTIPKLLSAVTASTDDKPLLRLKILENSYNILEVSPADRYVIFSAIMDFCSAAKHPEILIPHFKEIDKKIQEWGIDNKATRDLFKKIRDIYKLSSNSIEVHKWTVKYISTFEGNSDEQTNEAVAASLDAIRSPDLFQFDNLLELDAVKKLEKDPKHSKLHQLLTIFVADNFDSFKAFVNANPGLLQQFGLDEAECTKKMKYLSLASLGAMSHELSFATIAKTLQIGEDEVELWVISALGEGIIEAKIDQLKRTVRISRSLQRVFTRPQWKFLADNLNSWKKNIQILLQTLQDCKTQTQQQAIDLSRAGDVTQI